MFLESKPLQAWFLAMNPLMLMCSPWKRTPLCVVPESQPLCVWPPGMEPLISEVPGGEPLHAWSLKLNPYVLAPWISDP